MGFQLGVQFIAVQLSPVLLTLVAPFFTLKDPLKLFVQWFAASPSSRIFSIPFLEYSSWSLSIGNCRIPIWSFGIL